jgi:hypothetical protein
MSQEPSLVFALLLVSIYAAAYHLWKGRRLRDLPLYWLAAVLGFAAGHLAGVMLTLVPWTIGQIQIFEATAGAFLFLILIHWLLGEKKTP